MPELPDHELIEKVFDTEPNRIIGGFKDCYQKERAKENLRIVHEYVKEMREQEKADR